MTVLLKDLAKKVYLAIKFIPLPPGKNGKPPPIKQDDRENKVTSLIKLYCNNRESLLKLEI